MKVSLVFALGVVLCTVSAHSHTLTRNRGLRGAQPDESHVDGGDIRCEGDADAERFYRLYDGERRQYPKYVLAYIPERSLDFLSIVDCTNIPEGAPWPVEIPHWPEGEKGLDMHRDSTAVANMESPAVDSASSISTIAHVEIKNEQIIKCINDPDPDCIYFVLDGKRRQYVKSDIAHIPKQEIDALAITVDCSNIPEGAPWSKTLFEHGNEGDKQPESVTATGVSGPQEMTDGHVISHHVHFKRPLYDARTQMAASVKQLSAAVSDEEVLTMKMEQAVGALKEQLLYMESSGDNTNSHTHTRQPHDGNASTGKTSGLA